MISVENLRNLKQRYKRKRDSDDGEWVAHWKDLADYILPRHGRFVDRNTQAGKGDRYRHNKIINGTASRSVSIAVSGLKGGLVPHSLPWLKLSLWDEGMNDWDPAKRWLHDVQQILYGILTRSNFYSAVHTPFLEQLVFGTGAFAVYEDAKHMIHCTPWTIGSYTLAMDYKGEIDTGFRWLWMTARSAAQQFGKDNLTQQTRNNAERNPDAQVKVINAVFPRTDYDPNKSGSDNLPWASVYWEDGAPDDHKLKESGFHTQPVMFPRWEVVGEDAYGSNCPGMEELGDIKMLQKMERDKLAAIDKVVNPPMNVPSTLKGRLSLLPNAQNYVNAQENERIGPTLQITPDIAAIANEIREVENRIREGFFNDLFLMILNDKNMTATEVAQRHEEKLAILGPTLERQDSGLLSPFVDRVFDIAMRNGRFPPPPKELQGKDIKVEFTSLLAQAQKAVGTQSIEKTAMFAGNLAQFNPDVLDKVDFDVVLEEYATLSGASPKLLRSDDETAKIRKQRAEAQQQQAMMEQASQAAQAAKNLGQTPTGEDTALAGLLGQMPAV